MTSTNLESHCTALKKLKHALVVWLCYQRLIAILVALIEQFYETVSLRHVILTKMMSK